VFGKISSTNRHGLFFPQIDINSGSTKQILQNQQPHRYHFYNDADALEDAVLFPEELSAEGIDALRIGNIEPIKKWEDEGFSLADWAKGMDLVDSDDDDPSGTGDDDRSIISSSGDEWSYFGDNEPQIPINPQEMATMQKLMRHMRRYPRSKEVARDHAGMKEEYMRFLEREKARSQFQYREFAINADINTVFKEVWHNADLASLTRKIIIFLQYFLTSKQGKKFSGSLLFDQSKRAKDIPD